jgi:hypothetical protein
MEEFVLMLLESEEYKRKIVKRRVLKHLHDSSNPLSMPDE